MSTPVPPFGGPTDLRTCRWAGSDQPRMLADGTPCAQDHCQACGIVHVQPEVAGWICPACVADVRTELRTIADLSAKLPGESRTRGVASEAFHLDGPVADPEAWRQRGRHGHRYEPEAQLGDNHPLWVLGTWELLVCEERGIARHERIDVAGAAAFLERQLTDLARAVDFDFGALAGDLRRCRAHLEAVLHDGEQIEHGAPCMDCSRPVVKQTTEHGTTYRCERCRRTLTDNEYRLAVRAAHLAHADRLCADDLAERIDIPVSTIRRWANPVRTQRGGDAVDELPALLRSCGRDGRGRKVYRVDDALKIANSGGDRRRAATVSIDGAENSAPE